MSIETLRPNAAGDETSIASQYPASTYHWDKVDEETADDNTTYVYTTATSYQRDLYNLPAHSVGSGTINSITIYFRIAISNSLYIVYAKPSQKSGATVTDGTEVTRTSAGATTYLTYSQTYTTNPATGVAYTWDEIDALEIGLQLHSNNSSGSGRCTQVYVEVDYTVIQDIVVTPPTLALTLTTYVPTLPEYPLTVTPPTLALTLTSYAPTIGLTAVPPRLLSFDCRGVWYPTRRNIITCTVLCADGLATRNGTDDGQTGAVIKAAIEEARDTATWPVTFYDRDGNTIYVKVLSAKYRATSDTKDKNPEGVIDLVLMKVPLA
jgi:hypothetical protein